MTTQAAKFQELCKFCIDGLSTRISDDRVYKKLMNNLTTVYMILVGTNTTAKFESAFAAIINEARYLIGSCSRNDGVYIHLTEFITKAEEFKASYLSSKSTKIAPKVSFGGFATPKVADFDDDLMAAFKASSESENARKASELQMQEVMAVSKAPVSKVAKTPVVAEYDEVLEAVMKASMESENARKASELQLQQAIAASKAPVSKVAKTSYFADDEIPREVIQESIKLEQVRSSIPDEKAERESKIDEIEFGRIAAILLAALPNEDDYPTAVPRLRQLIESGMNEFVAIECVTDEASKGILAPVSQSSFNKVYKIADYKKRDHVCIGHCSTFNCKNKSDIRILLKDKSARCRCCFALYTIVFDPKDNGNTFTIKTSQESKPLLCKYEK